MFLFIFESIGMQELILIGVVGLIVLGPRKLPQLAKTIGKTMADFRKITGEFRSTWEREVEEDSKLVRKFASDPEMDVPNINNADTQNLIAPQVKELNAAEIEKLFPKKELETKTQNVENPPTETAALSKRDWI